MSILFWIIGSTFFVSLISLIGIFTLALNDKSLKKILLVLVGFSAGVLIGGAFLQLIPESQSLNILRKISNQTIFHNEEEIVWNLSAPNNYH
jgi:zinc transporter ZupT